LIFNSFIFGVIYSFHISDANSSGSRVQYFYMAIDDRQSSG